MIARVLDWIWPRTCAVCKRPVDRPGRHICSDCLNRLPFIATEGCCRLCGRSVEGLTGEYLCEDCRRNPPLFDRAGSALRFETETRELLHGYKFGRQVWLRDDLTEWLMATACARFDTAAIDLVLPMPLTWRHRIDRGYNQCDYLARGLAKKLDRRFLDSVLFRKGSPKRQSDLSEDARRINVIDTFAVRRSELVRGRTVLVVDDIMTTGSTLSECARALKAAGAWRVWCLTVARSVRS